MRYNGAVAAAATTYAVTTQETSGYDEHPQTSGHATHRPSSGPTEAATATRAMM